MAKDKSKPAAKNTSSSDNIDWTKAGILAGAGGLGGWLFNRYLLNNKTISSDIIASLIGATLTGGTSAAYDYFTSPEITKAEKKREKIEREGQAAEARLKEEEGGSSVIPAGVREYLPYASGATPTSGNPANPLASAFRGTAEWAIPGSVVFAAGKAGLPKSVTVSGGKTNVDIPLTSSGFFGRQRVSFEGLNNDQILNVVDLARRGEAGAVDFNLSQLKSIGDAKAQVDAAEVFKANKAHYNSFSKPKYDAEKELFKAWVKGGRKPLVIDGKKVSLRPPTPPAKPVMPSNEQLASTARTNAQSLRKSFKNPVLRNRAAVRTAGAGLMGLGLINGIYQYIKATNLQRQIDKESLKNYREWLKQEGK